jgi:hypothetical protein
LNLVEPLGHKPTETRNTDIAGTSRSDPAQFAR